MDLTFDDVVYQLEQLQSKIYTLEKERGNIPKAVSPFISKVKATTRTFGRSWSSQALYGVHLGVCVETRDPWKAGRIMVYCPIVHNIRDSKELSESTLTWARACSSFGSLDEVGSSFVPPEGSVVVIMFEGGNRDSMYYLGSTWVPSRANLVNTADDFTPAKETTRWQNVFPGIRESDVKTGTPNHLLPPSLIRHRAQNRRGQKLEQRGQRNQDSHPHTPAEITGYIRQQRRITTKKHGGQNRKDQPHTHVVQKCYTEQ